VKPFSGIVRRRTRRGRLRYFGDPKALILRDLREARANMTLFSATAAVARLQRDKHRRLVSRLERDLNRSRRRNGM